MAKKPVFSNEQPPLIEEVIAQPPEGYYSGDKQNLQLGTFAEAHSKHRPYDPATDAYNVQAFDKAINTTKATAIYGMHTYWSKKPHDAIRQYIRHYTEEGDLVLDPFCGSGGTAVAALMEGRSAIAIDRSPAATFITKNYCTAIEVSRLLSGFEHLKRLVSDEFKWLYGTLCDRCGGAATTTYVVFSQVFQCPRCMRRLPLFDCQEVEMHTASGKPTKKTVCPTCLADGHTEVIRSQDDRYGTVPVLVNYVCHGSCRPRRDVRTHNDSDPKKRHYFETYDVAKIAEVDRTPMPYWHPQAELADTIPYRMLFKQDFRPCDASRFTDLFTKRNLWAAAALLDAIKSIPADQGRDALLFTFTSCVLNLSRLYKHRDGGGGQPTGNYYIPQVYRENEAWSSLERKFADIAKGAAELGGLRSGEVCISTQSAVDLSLIPSNCVDYVFTDPPYAGTYQYGELNYIWEAWLGFTERGVWHSEEITINEMRGLTEKDWTDRMRKALSECFRVLKPGRALSLCYHDTSEGTWSLVQDLMAECGYVAEQTTSALFIDTGQKTYNQTQADKVTKRDLVISFRKPKPGEASDSIQITGEEDSTGFASKVRILIGEFLSATPGATKDRVYDHVVSHMVRAGTMQAHNFEELLEQVAEPVRAAAKKNLFEEEDPDLFGRHEFVRWYLKSTQLDVVDSAESSKEDAAAEKLATFIEQKIKASPWLDGVHYSDLFEHFIYGVHDKPRRPMVEWLLDYFFKTESGTYRLPATDEEAKIKAEGRSKGTARRIKRYLAFLEQGAAIPTGEQQSDSTLADWIRHSKLSGMYEAGKMLFERGGLSLDRLSEEAAVNVEEDYQVCVRMLSRQEKS
jgi:16S rRNA G966 N2-methylase RsmD